MTVIEHFQQKQNHTKKKPTYCRHSKFESDVQKNIAQATKSNARCLSKFIALGVLHNVFGILGGNTLKLRMPAMGRHSNFKFHFFMFFHNLFLFVRFFKNMFIGFHRCTADLDSKIKCAYFKSRSKIRYMICLICPFI